jgi:hypothetical protein
MAEPRVEGPTEAEKEHTLRLVTIGVPLGIGPDLQHGNEKRGMLRHGSELLNMDLDAYRLLNSTTISAPRQWLIDWYKSDGRLADPANVIDRCLEAGLLMEIDFGGQPVELWPRLRLQQAGRGRGPDANDQCSIHLPDRKPAQVDRVTYSVWAASDGRSLQAVADALAESVVIPREAIIAMLPLSVFRLLSQGAAFLDKVP